MYIRVFREVLDGMPDRIVAAATQTKAPKMYDPSGEHLTVIDVSGGQLTELDNELAETIRLYPPFGERSEVRQLLEELGRCSRLFIVSTSAELILVSDRSQWHFEALEGLYADLIPVYVEYREACGRFARHLDRLEE